jgi:hypothetical protein
MALVPIVQDGPVVRAENHSQLKRSIPDFAPDKHTAAGKRLGRGAEHFFDEGIKLAN